MGKYNDYPEVTKAGSGGGGGFRRFVLLVALVVLLAFGVAAWSGRAVVSPNKFDPATTDTTPTPPANGVAVNVSQSAPVSVNIQQPAPAPQPTSDYTSQLAFIEAQRAFTRGDEAYRLAERAYGHADVLHPRLTDLEARAGAWEYQRLELVEFTERTNHMAQQVNALTAGLMVVLVLIMVLGGALLWLGLHPPTPRPYTPATQPYHLTQTAEPLTVHLVEPAVTVREPLRNRSEPLAELTIEPVKLDATRPPTARERALLRGLHAKHKGSITAVCYEAYGAKNARIWQYVKDAVMQG